MQKRKTLGIILALAWPTVLEQILNTATQYVDSAMVGRLGAAATAAVGTTTTLSWLIGSSVSALGIGFLAYIAREIGANRRENAARAAAQSVLAVLASGLLFTALALSLSGRIPVWMHAEEDIRPMASRYFFIIYSPMLLRSATIIFGTALRAAGDTKTPMKINLMTNIINVALNYLLIYEPATVRLFGLTVTLPGAGLGVEGAAIATAVSIAIGGARMSLALWRHPILSPRGHSIRPDWTVLKPCLRVALPAALQRFGTSFGYVAFSSMINTLGTVSTAAHTIANTAESAFYIPAYGMQNASATLSGNAYGMRDKQYMREISRMLLTIEVLLMMLSGALLFTFAEKMMSFFTPDAEVIRLGAKLLRMVALSEPLYGVAIITEGILQGVGDTMSAFVFNIIGMWGVRVTGTFIVIRLLGMDLTAAWGCMIAHNVLLCVMLWVRFVCGRWNPLNAPDAEGSA